MTGWARNVKNILNENKKKLKNPETCFNKKQLVALQDQRKFKCLKCGEHSKQYGYRSNVRVHLRKHHFGGLAIDLTKELQNDLENSIRTAQISVAGTNNDGERQEKDESEITKDTKQLEFSTAPSKYQHRQRYKALWGATNGRSIGRYR